MRGRLVFWGLLFTGLFIYVLVFERPRPEQQPAVVVEDMERIFTCSKDETGSIQVSDGKTSLTLTHGLLGWKTARPAGADISPEIIESVVDAVTDAVVIDVIEEHPQDLAPYGLDRPGLIVTVTPESDRAPQKLLLGSTAPAGVSLYALQEGRDRVISIGTFLRFSVKTLLDKL